MEQMGTTVARIEDKPKTMIQEREEDSNQTRIESALLPASSGSEAQSCCKDELQLFVTALTVKILTECRAFKGQSQEEQVSHTKRFVNQTMEGLTDTEGVSPDAKYIKKICKAIVKELKTKFYGRRVLEIVIALQDPATDAVIVQSLQTHIKDLLARLAAKENSSCCVWKDVLQVMGFMVILLLAIFLIALIP